MANFRLSLEYLIKPRNKYAN